MSKEKIESILKASFNPSHLEVIDDGHKHIGHEGAKQGGHFTVIITSKSFNGIKPLDRHRMVYEALKPIKIHALAIRASEEK